MERGVDIVTAKSKLELRLQRDSEQNLLSGVGPGVGFEFIKAYFPKAQNTIKIASAYFSLKGYKIGKDFISPQIHLQILVGKEEGVHVKDALIKEILDEFSSCDEDLYDAISDLINRIKDGQFVIRDARELQVKFHSKFYICDDKYIWHGSANYTGNGLKQNAEQISVSNNLEQINLFSTWYDDALIDARDILGELLEKLEALTRLVNPFDVYLKTLLLLDNLPDLKRKPNAKIPTYYQKGVIANAIKQADEFGGGLIVAATGLGKTTIGVEIARHLLLSQQVKRIILIAPKGVMENWKGDFDDVDITPKYFNINTLFLKSTRSKKSQVNQLENALNSSNNDSLIIIDEVHFLRNQLLSQMTKGKSSLVYNRLGPVVNAGAKIFLLTATVYGTNNQNLNSLLYLLPHKKSEDADKLIPWEVKNSDEFTRLPVVTILGLPHVLRMARNRNDIDDNGRTFIKMSNEVRYLPESIKLYNVRYDLFLLQEIQNAFDNSYFDQANKIPNFRYDDNTNSLLESVTDSIRNSAIESWLSSSAAILDSIEENLMAFGKDDKLPSEDSKGLSINPQTTYTRKEDNRGTLMYLNKNERQKVLRPIAAKLSDLREDKLFKLNEIIEKHCITRTGKVIVFVNRYRTAQYLLGALEKVFDGRIQIGCTVETSEVILRLRENRSETLERFSPRSQSSNNQYSPDEEYSVLICTDADGVGVNLQDADTVVNYDPPKSADVLFQRAGRVLRMTTDPNRIVHLYNLIPSIVEFPETESAVYKSIKDSFDRMKYRHEKSRSILGSSVISENEYIEQRLDEEEIDVEKLTRENDVLEAIGGLWAESILSHTAVLEQNRLQAESLGDYVLSAMNYLDTIPYMFVLIEFEGKYTPILYDLKHERIENYKILEILDLISCTKSTIRANVTFSEVEHYANETVQIWCKVKKIPVSNVRKICALYLEPHEQAKDIKTFLKSN